MSIIKTISIGTKVNIHSSEKEFMITQIKIGSQNSITYLASRLNEDDNYQELWIIPNEITSIHKEETLINQCIK